MFPVGGPNPTADTMNYTCVINSAIWGGALLYYFIDARKWFKGPQITIDLDELTEGQEAALREEGLKVEERNGKAVVGGGSGSASKAADEST
ncbi:GABA-specific high-affinity permease [Elasticomyces elasticus]|uniref:GABA-specific high-affinity permease n=1 Tax=Exophiala sideris TaxID=1016849 RepID=A0ABR0JEZ0_9EURO|nr:GABA-specific high-affinity permease [Elasticomyces elasticus]KAK5025224.1 GABA-specific high-affinity permease [Exophiala sideris]KAK5029228.1 GABA-specific high-affinity permease [Exophiala sideris]KAK5063283.1 GABA-specific high-affinity permease [Exophiala sideris]KAK5178999.1 GABA-specific high-affinity permease [Eurotiomycetes sp. CCFEE 6388]